MLSGATLWFGGPFAPHAERPRKPRDEVSEQDLRVARVAGLAQARSPPTG